jgi:hypothetical protein
MGKSVTISRFGTGTDRVEVEEAWAKDKGRRRRKGRYVARQSMTKEITMVPGLIL